jgi:hypothetical protein
MIRFVCPACKSVLAAQDHLANTVVACSKCRNRLTVPRLATPALDKSTADPPALPPGKPQSTPAFTAKPSSRSAPDEAPVRRRHRRKPARNE